MAKIVRVSEAAALALHSMVWLARSGTGHVSVSEIADRLHASRAHLSKVLQRLSKAGLVNSGRGPTGGFRLAKPGENVSLLEVYEAVEGPLGDIDCLFPSPICGSDRCVLGSLLGDVHREVREYLSETMISEVTEVFGSESG